MRSPSQDESDSHYPLRVLAQLIPVLSRLDRAPNRSLALVPVLLHP